MSKVYQIRDWDNHFENDRSRSRDKCSFVCIPNKQHGMGFTFIMSLAQGSSVYGIFQMIVGACSQQRRPRNGWLTDTGRPSGRAWTFDDIALRFRRSVEEVRFAMETLCSERVGWILELDQSEAKDVTEESPCETFHLTADSPPSPLEEKGIEGKRKEEKGREGKEGVAVRLLQLLNQLTGKKFREVESSLKPIIERLSEPDVTEQGCAQMIRRQVANWKDNPEMREYLRPETLFRKSKFNSYYAAKDQPPHATNSGNNPKGFDANAGTYMQGKSGEYSKAVRRPDA